MKVVSEQRPNISEGKSNEDISRTFQSSRDSKCEDWGRNVSVVFKEQQGEVSVPEAKWARGIIRDEAREKI